MVEARVRLLPQLYRHGRNARTICCSNSGGTRALFAGQLSLRQELDGRIMYLEYLYGRMESTNTNFRISRWSQKMVLIFTELCTDQRERRVELERGKRWSSISCAFPPRAAAFLGKRPPRRRQRPARRAALSGAGSCSANDVGFALCHRCVKCSSSTCSSSPHSSSNRKRFRTAPSSPSFSAFPVTAGVF